MPSPFPGMDPYLEDPAGWLDFHNRLITYLVDDLNESLRGRYVARAGERVVIEGADERDRSIYPDVSLVHRPLPRSGKATAVHDNPVVVRPATAEFREAWIEIRDHTGRRVVTVIEVLSPSNKAPGSGGRRKYLRKQREVLASDAHLVEIDLLRAGAWTLAVPRGEARRAGEFEYLVSVSRASDRDAFELCPIRLDRRLPRIGVPLSGRDRDAVADLPSLIDRCYDRGQYRETLDYSGEPTPPLSPPWASWSATLLRRATARKRRR